jgi:hypothetical protein
MVKAQSKAGHGRPKFLERVEEGRYRVKGTELVVRQDGKGWKVEGHQELASETFASRHAATERIEALGLVPEIPAEEPKGEAKAEKPQEQPKRRPRPRKSEKVGASA